MATLRLSADTRTDAGKSVGKKMRRAGKIPAVLYGKGQGGVSLALDTTDVSHLLATPYTKQGRIESKKREEMRLSSTRCR